MQKWVVKLRIKLFSQHAFTQPLDALATLSEPAEAFDYYICPFCGYTEKRSAPEKCPVCGALAKQFIVVN